MTADWTLHFRGATRVHIKLNNLYAAELAVWKATGRAKTSLCIVTLTIYNDYYRYIIYIVTLTVHPL